MNELPIPKVPADPAKIRQAIISSGKKQTTISREAGIDKTTLSKQLAGQRPIDLEHLISIAMAIGVPWRSLLIDVCDSCQLPHCAATHSEVAA